ncbi:DUF3100 domain-containing protein [Haloplanus halophilus]|uniref:DUF3100 domain-containing protein n=1 Tax=Haloplanus halophilus TaxID=2949993 RepID=UPI00203F738D|nr:DUF3100 domain-containing protein [Haloplanus sp. GDY1]
MSGTDAEADESVDADSDGSRWDPIRMSGRWSFHLKAHLTVLAIVVVSEYIGTKTYPLGPGEVVILPMLYAVVFGMLLGYRVLGAYVDQLRAAIPKEVSEISSPLIVVALMPLGVKYGTLVAPNFYDIIGAGPAFLLQELGNLGTIFLALPLALLLGLNREAIGAAVSIAREPTLGIITDLYGPDSPEGIGVLGTYLTGTFLGTLFFGILGGIAPITGLHPRAIAMACGMGSGSMMTACAGSLATATTAIPDDEILAFAATSNLLTGLTGVYVVLFVGVPLINKLYDVLNPIIGRN